MASGAFNVMSVPSQKLDGWIGVFLLKGPLRMVSSFSPFTPSCDTELLGFSELCNRVQLALRLGSPIMSNALERLTCTTAATFRKMFENLNISLILVRDFEQTWHLHLRFALALTGFPWHQACKAPLFLAIGANGMEATESEFPA